MQSLQCEVLQVCMECSAFQTCILASIGCVFHSPFRALVLSQASPHTARAPHGLTEPAQLRRTPSPHPTCSPCLLTLPAHPACSPCLADVMRHDHDVMLYGYLTDICMQAGYTLYLRYTVYIPILSVSDGKTAITRRVLMTMMYM
jgi:hypothetical protein